MAQTRIDDITASIRLREEWQKVADAQKCCPPLPVQRAAPGGVGAVRGGVNSPEVLAVPIRPMIECNNYDREVLAALTKPMVECNNYDHECNETFRDIDKLANKDRKGWEEMMLAFYKAQVAFAQSDMATCSAEMQYFQSCAAKLYEKNKVDYDQIFKRLDQNRVLDGVGAAGAALGGTMAAISVFATATATAGAITAGAIMVPTLVAVAAFTISAMKFDKAFGGPIERKVNSYLPKGTYGTVELVLTLASSLFLNKVGLMGPIGMMAGGVEAAGTAYNAGQNKHNEQSIEDTKNRQELNRQAMDLIRDYFTAISDYYSKDAIAIREMMAKERQINDFK